MLLRKQNIAFPKKYPEKNIVSNKSISSNILIFSENIPILKPIKNFITKNKSVITKVYGSPGHFIVNFFTISIFFFEKLKYPYEIVIIKNTMSINSL